MENLFKKYVEFERNQIVSKCSEIKERANRIKYSDLGKLNMLTEEDFTNKFIYRNIDFKFIKNNKEYIKKYIMGFVEHNISLIKFGDLKIYSVENKCRDYHEFNENSIIKLVDDLLKDNAEYTITKTEDDSYNEAYKIEELNLYFSAFYND